MNKRVLFAFLVSLIALPACYRAPHERSHEATPASVGQLPHPHPPPRSRLLQVVSDPVSLYLTAR